MRNLYLLPIGKDRCGRPIYLSLNGNAIVDIDPRDPRKDLRTKWPPKEAYYGEPDCHLDPDLKPIFIDELIEESNQRLEATGDKHRYVLQDGRIFVNNDVEAGDDFTDVTWEKAVRFLENTINDKN